MDGLNSIGKNNRLASWTGNGGRMEWNGIMPVWPIEHGIMETFGMKEVK